MPESGRNGRPVGSGERTSPVLGRPGQSVRARRTTKAAITSTTTTPTARARWFFWWSSASALSSLRWWRDMGPWWPEGANLSAHGLSDFAQNLSTDRRGTGPMEPARTTEGRLRFVSQRIGHARRAFVFRTRTVSRGRVSERVASLRASRPGIIRPISLRTIPGNRARPGILGPLGGVLPPNLNSIKRISHACETIGGC